MEVERVVEWGPSAAQKDEIESICKSGQKKPRICEVLGVEVGERFSVMGQTKKYHGCHATWDGLVFCGAHTMEMDGLLLAMNHPESIRRKTHFTVMDAAVLCALYDAGARWIARGERRLRWYMKKPYQRAEDDKWDMRGDWGTMSGRLPEEMCLGLPSGQCMSIEEIMRSVEDASHDPA